MDALVHARPVPPRLRSSSRAAQSRSRASSVVSSASSADFTVPAAAPPLPRSPAMVPLTRETLVKTLERLLVTKSDEINMVGRLGEQLLNQQTELEHRVRELEEDAALLPSSADALSADGVAASVDSPLKQKLDALKTESRKWAKGNADMYRVVLTDNDDRHDALVSRSSLSRLTTVFLTGWTH
jgi:hypothetical protein